MILDSDRCINKTKGVRSEIVTGVRKVVEELHYRLDKEDLCRHDTCGGIFVMEDVKRGEEFSKQRE